MADPFDFMRRDPRFNDRRGSNAKPLDIGGVESVVLHDRGGSYPGHSPYHIEVLPDGRIMNHWGADQRAPHAYKLNPKSLSVSYGGQVGAQPTPEAMKSLDFVTGGLKRSNPKWNFESHGEAYRRTRGSGEQASRDGRGLEEASWRTNLFKNAAPASAGDGPPQSDRDKMAFGAVPVKWDAPAVRGASDAPPSVPLADRSMVAGRAPPAGRIGALGGPSGGYDGPPKTAPAFDQDETAPVRVASAAPVPPPLPPVRNPNRAAPPKNTHLLTNDGVDPKLFDDIKAPKMRFDPKQFPGSLDYLASDVARPSAPERGNAGSAPPPQPMEYDALGNAQGPSRAPPDADARMRAAGEQVGNLGNRHPVNQPAAPPTLPEPPRAPHAMPPGASGPPGPTGPTDPQPVRLTPQQPEPAAVPAVPPQPTLQPIHAGPPPVPSPVPSPTAQPAAPSPAAGAQAASGLQGYKESLADKLARKIKGEQGWSRDGRSIGWADGTATNMDRR